MFFHNYIYYIDYAPTDKNRQKLLLSSRDWETLATEYDYWDVFYVNLLLFFLVVIVYVKKIRHYQKLVVLNQDLIHVQLDKQIVVDEQHIMNRKHQVKKMMKKKINY
jgi:hypothetical protein